VLGGELKGGYYVKPTVFKGHNKMRIFQEEDRQAFDHWCCRRDSPDARCAARSSPRRCQVRSGVVSRPV
jgi:hypothetical protein